MAAKKVKQAKKGGTAAVQVAVRIRPMNDQEKEAQQKKQQDERNGICAIKKNDQTIELIDPKNKMKRTFQYNYCYGDQVETEDETQKREQSQEDIYNDLGIQVIDNAFDAFNTCIFAYGQTGSGKTYTTFGEKETPGVIPRICHGLFERIREQEALQEETRIEQEEQEKQEQEEQEETLKPANITVSYNVTCTMVELYNEKFYDLLGKTKESLPMRDDPKKGPFIEGLTIHNVKSEEDIMKLIQIGNKRKMMAATNSNARSSRSHTLFQIVFTQTRKVEYPNERPRKFQKKSRINLVDLAGSERVAKTGTTGERFKEGVQINLSLSALGTVINALAENSRRRRRKLYVNYRASKLTYLMRDSLGGNSKTIMIATISPSQLHFSETRSTLLFATRANAIINQNVRVNEEDDLRKMLFEKNQLIAELQEEIAALKNTIQETQPIETQNEIQKVDTKEVEKYREMIRKLQDTLHELSHDNTKLYDINETFHGHHMQQYLNATGFHRPKNPHLVYLYTDSFSPAMQDTTESQASDQQTTDQQITDQQTTEREEGEEREDEGEETDEALTITEFTADVKTAIHSIYTFRPNVTTIGTDYDAENDIILPIAHGFSQHHGTFPLRCATKIVYKSHDVTIEPQRDLNQFTNILYVNGQSVCRPTKLTNGDHLQLGAHHFLFCQGDPMKTPQIYFPPSRHTSEIIPAISHFQAPYTSPTDGIEEEEDHWEMVRQYANNIEEEHTRRLQDVEIKYQQALMRAEAERDRALVQVEHSLLHHERTSIQLKQHASIREKQLESELATIRSKLEKERSKSIWSRVVTRLKDTFKPQQHHHKHEDESDEDEWDNFEVIEDQTTTQT